ncbi:MAG: hypothetical protein R3B70_17630 [Polyangiaceae bacterium]
MMKRALLSVVLGGMWLGGMCAACSGAGTGTTTSTPVAVDIPIQTEPEKEPETAPVATSEEPSASEDKARAEQLAQAALKKQVSFSSASRLEINKQFPHAEELRAAATRAGAPFSDDDWFGDGEPVPARWELSIGADIDVAAAQAMIAACLLTAKTPFHVERMDHDSEFGNRNRIYVGGLNASAGPTTSYTKLADMLAPGLTKGKFYSMLPPDSD